MEKGDPIKEYVVFQLRRKITNLYKQFLFILEDAHTSKYNTSDETYQKYRKRVLTSAVKKVAKIISREQISTKKYKKNVLTPMKTNPATNQRINLSVLARKNLIKS